MGLFVPRYSKNCRKKCSLKGIEHLDSSIEEDFFSTIRLIPSVLQ